MREWGLDFLTLTYNNDNKSASDDTAKRHAKRLLEALRDEARRKGWQYWVYICFSREEAKPDLTLEGITTHSRQEKRPHFHIILFANPCSTVARWMRYYWNPPAKSKRKRRGIVHKKKIYDLGGAVDYCITQAIWSRTRSYGCDSPVTLERMETYEKNEG